MKSYSGFLAMLFVCLILFSCRTKTPDTGTNTANNDTTAIDDTANTTTGAKVPPPAGVKYGYLNSLQLLSLMPETKEADKKVAEYTKKKESSFKALVDKYQTKIADLQKRASDIPPIEMEKHSKDIAAMEEQLQDMQMRAEGDISNEKEKLYAPILTKADSIVKLVGEENGYTFIYDAAALLYADTTLNLLPLVKERLGIK